MMNVLIVDDENPARERLSRLVRDLDGYRVVGDAENGREAIRLYQQLRPEIILLDIRMPVMDGLETARHLMSDEQPPAIIFITAYGDHALEAFHTHAVDYLLKPVRGERLREALAASQRPSRAQMASALDDGADSGARSHICVRHRGNLELIPVDDIFFFRAEDKYVTLHHRNGQALIEDSLLKLEREFGDRFLRIHRNALVAADQINGLQKQTGGGQAVMLKDSEQTLEVSRRHLAGVRRFLRQ